MPYDSVELSDTPHHQQQQPGTSTVSGSGCTLLCKLLCTTAVARVLRQLCTANAKLWKVRTSVEHLRGGHEIVGRREHSTRTASSEKDDWSRALYTAANELTADTRPVTIDG